MEEGLNFAIKAFRPEARMVFDAPYTPEKVLMSLYAQSRPRIPSK